MGRVARAGEGPVLDAHDLGWAQSDERRRFEIARQRAALTQQLYYAGNDLVIGAANYRSSTDPYRRNFDGLIDEVRLTESALTPTQMLAVPVPLPAAVWPAMALLAALGAAYRWQKK